MPLCTVSFHGVWFVNLTVLQITQPVWSSCASMSTYWALPSRTHPSVLTSGRVEPFRVPSRERVPETLTLRTHTQETSAAHNQTTIASCSSGLAQNCLQSSLLLPTLRYNPRSSVHHHIHYHRHNHHHTSVLFLHVRPSTFPQRSDAIRALQTCRGPDHPQEPLEEA